MKPSVLLFLLLWAMASNAQKGDYKKIRPDIVSFGCGEADSSHVYGTLSRLLTVDTAQLQKNLHMYYEDLAMCYWLASGGDSRELMLDRCIQAHLSSLHHLPDNTSVLWGLSFAYVMKGDCERGQQYLADCKRLTKPKFWNAEQAEALLRQCE